MDFILAVSLLIFLLIIYFSYTANLSKNDAKVLNGMTNDIKLISSSLILGGYPSNWSDANVQRVGLTDNSQRVVESKLVQFVNLSYIQRKNLFNTQYDYFIFFKDSDNCLINLSGNFGIGHPDVRINEIDEIAECNGFAEESVNLSDIQPKNIVRADRLLIYNSEIADMVVYLWQK